MAPQLFLCEAKIAYLHRGSSLVVLAFVAVVLARLSFSIYVADDKT